MIAPTGVNHLAPYNPPNLFDVDCLIRVWYVEDECHVFYVMSAL